MTEAATRTGPAPIGDNSKESPDAALTVLEVALLGVKLRGTEKHEDPVAKLEAKLEGFKATGIRSDFEAGQVRDLKDEAHKYLGTLEADEEARKRPLMNALTKVRGLFAPFATRTGSVKSGCTTLETAWMVAERARRQAEADAIEAEAQRKRDLAASAAAQAATPEADAFTRLDAGDAHHEAEQATIEADHAHQVAAARPSISGYSGARASSLRTTWSAEVEDGAKLVRHYAKRAEMQALALQLASAEMRATKGQAKIPGAKAKSTEKSV